MKLALIPPNAFLDKTVDDYHLILPQQLGDGRYYTKYQQHRRQGHYLILDNGAAEGIHFTVDVIHTLARDLMVNEIIVHDVMNDYYETKGKVQSWTNHVIPNTFNYMGVVQGKTLADCKACVDLYLDIPWITSIGIPRHLITTVKDGMPEIRLSLVLYIREQQGNDVNIHLLGTSPDYITELRDWGRHFNYRGVRGVDTSAPFNYAMSSELLVDSNVILRPKGYFKRTEINEEVLDLNIKALHDWINHA